MNKSWAARNSWAACQQKTLHLRSQRTEQLPETQAENVAFHMKNTFKQKACITFVCFLSLALLAWGLTLCAKSRD